MPLLLVVEDSCSQTVLKEVYYANANFTKSYYVKLKLVANISPQSYKDVIQVVEKGSNALKYEFENLVLGDFKLATKVNPGEIQLGFDTLANLVTMLPESIVYSKEFDKLILFFGEWGIKKIVLFNCVTKQVDDSLVSPSSLSSGGFGSKRFLQRKWDITERYIVVTSEVGQLSLYDYRHKLNLVGKVAINFNVRNDRTNWPTLKQALSIKSAEIFVVSDTRESNTYIAMFDNKDRQIRIIDSGSISNVGLSNDKLELYYVQNLELSTAAQQLVQFDCAQQKIKSRTRFYQLKRVIGDLQKLDNEEIFLFSAEGESFEFCLNVFNAKIGRVVDVIRVNGDQDISIVNDTLNLIYLNIHNLKSRNQLASNLSNTRSQEFIQRISLRRYKTNSDNSLKFNFSNKVDGNRLYTSDRFFYVKGNVTDRSCRIRNISLNGKEITLYAGDTTYFNELIDLQELSNKELSFRIEDDWGNVYEKTLTLIAEKLDINNILKEYKNYALLIAEQKYVDGNDLIYPIKNAQKLKEILVKNYTFDSNHVFLRENLTRHDLIALMDSLSQILKENDQLLIYYAGHGSYDSLSNRGFWIASDGIANNKSNWFSNSDLRDYISGFRAKHVLLIADACFGGSILDLQTRDMKQELVFQSLFTKKSRQAITSGFIEPVPDNSVFSKYLLKFLEENKSKYYSATDLFSEVRIPSASNSGQTPHIGIIHECGHEGGEFFFIKK